VTKAQIVNRIARNFHMPRKEASRVVNTFCEGISSSLKKGNSVSITGFGSFSVKQLGGFTARNPRTGSSRKVSPFKTVVFTPSSSWNPAKSRKKSSSRKGFANRSSRNYFNF